MLNRYYARAISRNKMGAGIQFSFFRSYILTQKQCKRRLKHLLSLAIVSIAQGLRVLQSAHRNQLPWLFACPRLDPIHSTQRVSFSYPPYVSGYLSLHLKLKNLKGEARGHEAKELFERIQGISNQEDDATQSGICFTIV